MIRRISKTYIRYDFATWSELLDQVQNRPSVVDDSRRMSRRDETGSKLPFTGTQTFAHALEVAAIGDQKLAETIGKMAAPIIERACSLMEKHDLVYAQEGAAFDVARVVQNEPECWMDFVPTIADGKSNKIVQIMFNGTVNFMTPTKIIENKGKAVAGLIQVLEYAGLMVELTVVGATRCGPYVTETYIKVKNADQHLDVPRLCFALASPSMLRRFIVGTWETELTKQESDQRDIGEGYGRAEEAKERGDIYIGQADQIGNPEAWIMSQLRNQGIKLEKGE